MYRPLRRHYAVRQVLAAFLLGVGSATTITCLFLYSIAIGGAFVLIHRSTELLWYALYGVLAVILGIWLRKASVKWLCHQCKKRMHSNQPWICGTCAAKNTKASVLDRCGDRNCLGVPHSFQCKECGTLTFLTPECDPTNPARHVGARFDFPVVDPVKEKQEADALLRQEEIAAREHEKRKLGLELELADLRKKLNPPEPPVRRSPQELWLERIALQLEHAKLQGKTMVEARKQQKEQRAQIGADTELDEKLRGALLSVMDNAYDDLCHDIAQSRAVH